MNSATILLWTTIMSISGMEMLLCPESYICPKGYEFTPAGGLSALQDAVAAGDEEKTFYSPLIAG